MSSRFQLKKAKRVYLETSRLGKSICANRHCTNPKAEKFIVHRADDGKQFTIQVCDHCLHLFEMEKIRQEENITKKQQEKVDIIMPSLASDLFYPALTRRLYSLEIE